MSGLERLNSLPASAAESEFLKCCGAKAWALSMVEQRPFADVAELLSKADDIWQSLGSADWLEAFRSHPKIGEQKAQQAQSETAQTWSEQEQAGTLDSAAETMKSLAEGNHQYEERFGHIFIVCASGKTANEMLAILQARLPNDLDLELHVAAEEQRKITSIRLQKLVIDPGP